MKLINKLRKKNLHRYALVIYALLPVTIAAGMWLFYSNKIYPGIYFNSRYAGGMTKEAATESVMGTHPPEKIILQNGEGMQFEIGIGDINFKYEYDLTVDKAFSLGRQGPPLGAAKEIMRNLLHKKTVEMEFSYDAELLDEYLSAINGQIATEPVYPSAQIVNGNVIVNPGKAGEEIDRAKVLASLEEMLAKEDFNVISIPLIYTNPALSEEDTKSFRDNMNLVKDKELTILSEYDKWTYSGNNLLQLYQGPWHVSKSATDTVIANIKATVDREAQNPIFLFEDGKVKEFAPAKDGLTVDGEKFSEEISVALINLIEESGKHVEVNVPVSTTPPSVGMDEINNLGIKEMIGRGTSSYKGSIPSRVFNVDLAASRINGTLVAPGQVLSFNDSVGDVSKLTGYKDAYIIQNGRTVLGDGGGVCQVSTTLFRAALNAGLPITERRSHSYRVGYYEQDAGPGLDATVYAPTTDLKITNDTPGHILVQAYADTKNYTLTFELYGSSDGRKATITKPVITSSTPPPEDLYIDDPTLPVGTVNQVEHKVWGAKTQFDYKVERSGEVIYEKTFYSTYKPWQAVFMRGVAPVPAP